MTNEKTTKIVKDYIQKYGMASLLSNLIGIVDELPDPHTQYEIRLMKNLQGALDEYLQRHLLYPEDK